MVLAQDCEMTTGVCRYITSEIKDKMSKEIIPLREQINRERCT